MYQSSCVPNLLQPADPCDLHPLLPLTPLLLETKSTSNISWQATLPLPLYQGSQSKRNTGSTLSLPPTQNDIHSLQSYNSSEHNSNMHSQQKLDQWMVHRPFNPGVLSSSLSAQSKGSTDPRSTFNDHLLPYDTPIVPYDPTSTLRVCVQNTHFAFQLYDDGINLANIICNILILGAKMFVPISPNINWENPSNWSHITRLQFHNLSTQIHLTATSSMIGMEHEYTLKSLVGGSAIITSGLWASKVSQSTRDLSGYGTFTTTTIQGKHNKKVTFIAAYIAIQKGSNIGIDFLYAQQTTVYEKLCRKNTLLSCKFCLRTNAIQRLNEVVHSFQKQHHAIVLMLDANQTKQEYFTRSKVKPHTIEWLRLKRGMIDPFISFTGNRPNSTLQTPNRDINYILTHGIQLSSISTLGINNPEVSDPLEKCSISTWQLISALATLTS
jgi:hypothetical protein